MVNLTIYYTSNIFFSGIEYITFGKRVLTYTRKSLKKRYKLIYPVGATRTAMPGKYRLMSRVKMIGPIFLLSPKDSTARSTLL